MALSESLASEPLSSRRFRLIAPLLVLLGLALLVIAPGIVMDVDQGTAAPRALTKIAGPVAGG